MINIQGEQNKESQFRDVKNLLSKPRNVIARELENRLRSKVGVMQLRINLSFLNRQTVYEKGQRRQK